MAETVLGGCAALQLKGPVGSVPVHPIWGDWSPGEGPFWQTARLVGYCPGASALLHTVQSPRYTRPFLSSSSLGESGRTLGPRHPLPRPCCMRGRSPSMGLGMEHNQQPWHVAWALLYWKTEAHWPAWGSLPRPEPAPSSAQKPLGGGGCKLSSAAGPTCNPHPWDSFQAAPLVPKTLRGGRWELGGEGWAWGAERLGSRSWPFSSPSPDRLSCGQ